MGKILTRPQQNKEQKLTMSQFYGMKQSKNALYQSKISQSSNREKLLLKKIVPFGDEDVPINSYIAKLQYLGQHIQGENLHLPVYCEVKEGNEFCADTKNLEVYYQDYDVKIKEEINARKRQYEHFSEAQVWYMLYSIVNALRKFQRFNLKSGNLTTQKILLNEKGHLKLVNQLTSPDCPEFASLQSQNTENSSFQYIENFYAPQQLQAMQGLYFSNTSQGQRKIHPNVCQTFSLGIIILEICTFIEGSAFYDMRTKQLNGRVFDKALQLLDNIGYSRLLQSLVRVLLSSQFDRPLPSQIYSVFRPYERQILSLHWFNFQAGNLYNSLYPSQAFY